MTRLNTTSILKTVLAGSITALSLTMATPHLAIAQEENPLIVEADNSLEWLRNEKQYVATGNATATQGDLSLFADIITAHYDTENTAQGDHDASSITFIKGEKSAKLIRATLTATADIIEYDIVSEFVKVIGGTPTIINGQDTLSARDIITYDRRTRQIIATGDAKIKMSDGQELHGNVITVIITKDEGDIETVTAEGKTLVISPTDTGVRRANADKLIYTRDNGIAILTGDVKIQDGNNFLTGDNAEVNTITGTSTMSSSQKGKRVGGIFKPAE